MTTKKTRPLTPAVKALVGAGVPLDVAWAARDAAARSHVPLARLIAVAEAETGFRNVWGHDAGKWRESGPLTRQSVARYFARPAGERPNGAGVWQLTWGPFQTACERDGGLHDLEAQAREATLVLERLPSRGATAATIALYNGSGPAARSYGAKVHGREKVWQLLINRSQA